MISTVASYRGAQVFEAIGLSQELVDEFFTGTTTQLGGIDLDVIAAEAAGRHAGGLPAGRAPAAARRLAVGGEYQWRREGEPHLFDPETVFRLQHSTRASLRRLPAVHQPGRRAGQAVDDPARPVRLPDGQRPPVPIEEVEPVEAILRGSPPAR